MPALLCGALALAGCGRKRSLEVPARPSRPLAVEAPKPMDLRTQGGALKGSDVRVAWLEIPLAFRPTQLDRPERRVFEAEGVSLERVRDFLAPRMMTGQVEETKRAVTYRKVLPPSGAADAVQLDVRLSQLDARVTLEVEPLPHDVKPLPFEAAKAAAEAEQKYAH